MSNEHPSLGHSDAQSEDIEPLIDGRYRVGSLIGKGGMANVYRATDVTNKKTLAIKIIKPKLAADPSFRARFRREARFLSNLDHPSIMDVIDSGEETITRSNGKEVTLLYMVMELVKGQSLRDLINDGALSSEKAISLTMKTLAALAYAHESGMVHRNIKPENIMVTPSGNVKLMDFGIARAVTDSSTDLTQTTAILRNAAYLSPEQARGEAADSKSDLYSLGIVLYEMLTGKPPFHIGAPNEVAKQHISEVPPAPNTVLKNISTHLNFVVVSALQKARRERYQSANEFARDLDRVSKGEGPKGPGAEAPLNLLEASTDTLSVDEIQLRQLVIDETEVQTNGEHPPFVRLIWAAAIAITVTLLGFILWTATLPSPNGSWTQPNSVVTVPKLVETNIASGEDALKGLGLSSRRIEVPSDSVPAGIILRTEPNYGERIEKSVIVKLYVSSGPVVIEIPYVGGLSASEAVARLTSAGLVVVTEIEPSTYVRQGLVIDTDPTSGTEVGDKATVTMRVSSGPEGRDATGSATPEPTPTATPEE